MITTRDIKVFIFSIFITTLCLALFKQPIKKAEAQDGGGLHSQLGSHDEWVRDYLKSMYQDQIQHENYGYKGNATTEIIEKLDTLLAR